MSDAASVSADAVAAFTGIAFDAFKHSQHQKALDSLTSALNLTPEPSPIRAKTLLNRATICRSIRDFTAAADDAHEALLILQDQEISDLHLVASVLHCLGEIYLQSDQPALGRVFKAKAMEVLCETPRSKAVKKLSPKKTPEKIEKASPRSSSLPAIPEAPEPVQSAEGGPRTETSTSKSGGQSRRKKLFQKAATGAEIGEVKIARQKTFVNAFADYRRTDGSSLATEKRKIYFSDQNILLEKFRQRAFSFHCEVSARSFEDLYELKTYCRGVCHAVRMRTLSAHNAAITHALELPSPKLMLQPTIGELKKLQETIRKPETVEIRKIEPKRSSFLMSFSGMTLKSS